MALIFTDFQQEVAPTTCTEENLLISEAFTQLPAGGEGSNDANGVSFNCKVRVNVKDIMCQGVLDSKTLK